MKKEGIGAAVVGGIIAGAALGTGFLLAQKFIVKSQKSSGIAKEEVIMTTKPASLDTEMSNLVGDNLVTADKWSNAFGFGPAIASRVNCVNSSGQLYNGGSNCAGGRPATAKDYQKLRNM